MNLSHELALARTQKGFSQASLADALGVSRLAIVRMEGGVGSVALLLAAMKQLEVRFSGIARGATLPDQIRARRERLKISIQRAAELAGLDMRTVVSVEEGRGTMASLGALLGAIAPKATRSTPARSSWSYDQSGHGESDKRFTPQWFLDYVYTAFGEIDLDPCSHPQALVKAKRYICLPECGIQSSWRGTQVAYVNPPFSAVVKWYRRASDAWISGEAKTIVMLVPTRTDSDVFQRMVSRDADVLFLGGRMRFESPEGLSWHAPFALMLVIWGATEQSIRNFMELAPCVWMRPWGEVHRATPD
jgi:transcriptional regulator with XRE-family HTH domain